MTQRAGFLFTAFEPSGDALAAAVIAQLKALRPDEPIWALGGPRCRAAGAEMLEETTEHAVMLFDSLRLLQAHRRRLSRLERWLEAHPIAGLVPTDSPAANWSICKLVRRRQRQAQIVHLAAPQLWAWAPWRIDKLRRLTDHLLCLLPFEPAWFERRGVPATFVGHPLFAEARPATAPAAAGQSPRLALLPGSRTNEIKKNWPTMRAACDVLQGRHAGLTARVAALDERSAALIHDVERRTRGAAPLPATITVQPGQIGAVLDWCDAVLVVSGTAALEVATYGKPMVVLYNISAVERLIYHALRRWMFDTTTLSLPNLVAEWQGLGRVVPEFVPHDGRVDPVVRALEPLLVDPAARQRQCASLAQVVAAFADGDFSRTAARLLEVAETPSPQNPSAGMR